MARKLNRNSLLFSSTERSLAARRTFTQPPSKHPSIHATVAPFWTRRTGPSFCLAMSFSLFDTLRFLNANTLAFLFIFWTGRSNWKEILEMGGKRESSFGDSLPE